MFFNIVRAQQRQDELLEKSEVKEKYSDDEESEYEEYTDTSEEEEDDLPRLRPVFVKKLVFFNYLMRSFLFIC